MLPFYVLVTAAVGLYAWHEDLFSDAGFRRLLMVCLMPVFIPLATMGARCWDDGNAPQNVPKN